MTAADRSIDGQASLRLLGTIRAEIGRADSKAAVLMAALGLAGSVHAALLVGRGWSPGSSPRQGRGCTGSASPH